MTGPQSSCGLVTECYTCVTHVSTVRSTRALAKRAPRGATTPSATPSVRAAPEFVEKGEVHAFP